MVKGLPDQALQKEARQPTGQVPQFLVVSEIQRRGDMRQRFQKRQENQGTVKDQILQQGIAAMGAPQPEMQALAGGPPMPPQGMPPQGMQPSMPQAMPPQMTMQQPPMGMYAGGVVQMNQGGTTGDPFTEEDRIRLLDSQEQNYLKLLELRDQGVSDMQIAQAIQDLGLNPNIFNQLNVPTLGTMEATMPMPSDAYSQDAYADIFARQQGDIPAGMEFVEPRNVDDLLNPARSQMTPVPSPVGQEAIDAMYQSEYGKMLAQQSQARRDAEVASPAVGGGQDFVPSQRGIGSAPEGTAAALQAQIQALSSNPAIPSDQADFAMPDFDSYRQMINSALAPPEGTGDRRVGNLFGSDQVAPFSVDGSAPASALPAVDNSALAAQLVAESQARRGREAGAAVGTFDAPAPQNNALIEQLIAGSEARRNQEPSPAVRGGLTDAEFQARNREVVSGLIPDFLKNDPSNPAFGSSNSEGDSSQSINDSPRRQAMLASMERIRQAQADAPLLPFIPEGTRSEIIARRRENPILSSIEAGTSAADLERSQERMAASLEGSPLEGIYDSPLDQSSQFNMAENLIDIANNQAGAVQTDGNRGVRTGSVTDSEVVDLALADGTSADASGRSIAVDQKDTNRDGTAGKSVQGTGSAESRLAGRVGEGSDARSLLEAGGERRKATLESRQTLADLIENQERPTLSYEGLLSDYEKQMQSQLADIKREKGSQALIALGAGIARGDLGSGLSDAGKAVAASNAQKRALEARQQAMQMGLKKSEIDEAFQGEVQKQANKLEAQKTRISALESYGAKQDAAEQTVLNFENGIDKVLAEIGVKRDYYNQLGEQSKETSRRAILNYVEGIISRQNMAGQDKQAQDAMRQQLLREAASILNVPVGEISGSTSQGNSGTKPNAGRFQVEEI